MGKLGYSTLTLTDLTETLPVSLVLESNLSQNIQTKIGSLYTPDLSKDGEELIITPSLFIGTEEVETIPVKKSEEQDSNYIYYQTGDVGENGIEINYIDSSTKKDGIWVDNEGRLHYNKNLNRNITIEAYINNFKNEEHNYTIELVKTTNPINVLFLEEGNNNYNVVITTSGGREHFEEDNASPIELTATLYHGVTPITDNIEYLWDVVTDLDDDPLKNWSANTRSITVERALVKSVEVFNCTIKNKTTGLSYFSTKILRDFTDGYTNQLIADNTLILTPNNTSVRITNQVWHKTSIINNEENQTRFKYKWSVLKTNGEQVILEKETGKTLIVIIDDNTFPRENFSILGEVTIDDKVVTVNYADIKYQSVTYTVNISPKTIFVPATDSGIYRGEGGFIQKIKFQLLDDNKQPLAYDINDSGPTSLINNNDNSSIKITRKDSSIWDFDIEFTLDTSSSNNLWGNINSKTYEFTYEYLDNIFTEEFEVVKNYAGINGNPGYTVDLSNNFHAFFGGEGRADLDQETEIKFYAYYGDKGLTIKKISLIDNGEEISDGYEVAEGLYIKRKNTTDKNGERTYILYTAKSGDSFLTENGAISFYITVEDDVGIKTFYKPFQYIINFNGKSYFLQFNENSIIYGANANYNPNQVTATAYYRETNGVTQKYEKGRIRYTTDGINWKNGIGSVVVIMNNNLFVNNINFELYSSQDTSWDEKYLLDKETIPVLVSLEGTQIGGENLLPRTKDLALEEDLWKIDEIFSIEKDNDFSVISCNVTNTNSNYNIYSSKVSLKEEFFEKTFCFSFLIYSEDWNKLNNLLITAEGFKEIKDQDEEFETRECYNNFGFISQQTTNLFFEEDKVSNKWLKVYQFFNLSSSSFIQEKSSIENCEILRIVFTLEKSGQIKIKKPKLEIGNIPTDWSSAVNDFLFSAIAGLEGDNLKEILTNYLTKINNSNDRLTLTVGNTTITSLKELEEYLSTEIGVVKTELSDTKNEIINSHIETLKNQFNEITGTISQIKSYINLGYENDAKRTPYLLLGTEDEGINTTMKVTNEKMIFQVGGEKDFETTLSNQYLDTNRIRTRDGVYIGKTDYVNNSGTGYLVISTTEQGVGFKWMNVFSGG